MLTLAKIKSAPEEVIERLKVKNFDAKDKINEILRLDV